jgi:hypothetical protein
MYSFFLALLPDPNLGTSQVGKLEMGCSCHGGREKGVGPAFTLSWPFSLQTIIVSPNTRLLHHRFAASLVSSVNQTETTV